MSNMPSPADFNALGRQLELAGKRESAMEAFRGALALDPGFRPAAANLARLLVALDRPREAVALLEPVTAGAPFDVALAVNYANALMGIGRVVEAEQRLRAVTSGRDVPAQAFNSLGIARYIQRDFVAARDIFHAAIAADPEFAEAHENLAQTLLCLGDYQTAWTEYDWRWRNPSNALTKRIVDVPEWDGRPLDGRTLLLYGEQGHGDTIQFARYAALVERGSGGTVLLACQKNLGPLLASAAGIDGVHFPDAPLPLHDCQAPIMTLPRLLGPRIGYEPFLPARFIAADPAPDIASRPGLKIGINWTGKAVHPDDPYRNRSCPPGFFASLAESVGATLFSLQFRARSGEVELAKAIDLGPRIDRFEDSARVIAALDLVVTIDTAVAHIAGALGKPCWVLVPYANDWRWQPNAAGTQPWYAFTRVVRQSTPGDWAEAFARTVSQLSQYVANIENPM